MTIEISAKNFGMDFETFLKKFWILCSDGSLELDRQAVVDYLNSHKELWKKED